MQTLSSSRAAVALFSFFLSALCLVFAALTFSANTWAFYREFGFHNPMLNAYLHRFVFFSLISFSFNMAFGAYFGLVCCRQIFSAGSGKPGMLAKHINWGLAGFFLWCALFNLPGIRGNLTVPGAPPGGWPPTTLPLSIRIEMVLFFVMGNLGAFAGFAGSIAWSLIFRITAKRPPRHN